MVKEIINILNTKHLLIVGKSEIERKVFISEIIKNANFETFRFPSKMKSFDEYYNFIKTHRLYSPWYEAKSYNENQILDFHWDWISQNNSLIIMEEIDLMENIWKIELLRIYINIIDCCKKGEKKVKLIISQEKESSLIEKLSGIMHIGEHERRTQKQIVEQNLVLIDIS